MRDSQWGLRVVSPGQILARSNAADTVSEFQPSMLAELDSVRTSCRIQSRRFGGQAAACYQGTVQDEIRQDLDTWTHRGEPPCACAV